MLCITQHESFLYAAFSEARLNVRRDVDKSPPGRDFKPEFFSVALHRCLLGVTRITRHQMMKKHGKNLVQPKRRVGSVEGVSGSLACDLDGMSSSGSA